MELKEILAQKTLFAFNLDDFTIFKGIIRALEEKKSPAIIQLSAGEASFWGLENFIRLAKPLKDKKIFLNIDHGKNLELLKKAIDLGFDMVHFDGSALSWEENINLTAKASKLAHSQGVIAEGEPESQNTNPAKVAEFVRKTKVDLVAVFCGNKHGFNLQKPENLNFERLREIKKAAKPALLALHGGSGVPEDQIKKAIKEKLIAKININSVLRDAYFKTLKKQLSCYKGNKAYDLLGLVSQAVSEKANSLLA
ncbi:MAG: class II fructose-bisphosphate aldolase [Candidatus Shapirobacteria bacterium]